MSLYFSRGLNPDRLAERVPLPNEVIATNRVSGAKRPGMTKAAPSALFVGGQPRRAMDYSALLNEENCRAANI